MSTRLLKQGLALWILGLIAATVTLLLGFAWAPSIDNETMNAPAAQRIFYWHVPSAWASMLAFTALFIGSLAWFWKRSEWGWRLHVSAAEAGVLFGLMAVTSGPIWGQAEWGVAWDWTDIRINTFGLLTALSAYLVVARRSQPDGDDARDTFSAVGLFGFALVPLTYMATRWWERRHPGPVVGPGGGGLEPEMATTMWIGVFSFMLLLTGLMLIEWFMVSTEQRIARIQNNMDGGE
ncbi:MAG: cytochrome c biogenesis protein CcsA [Candidatus Poseidoniaceae archaeon]|jgi:heme exporter protein C|nr:cytochrome c biogenesis protein CcsA [Candidatus Poseidoniaceae archaeon]MDP7202796.1 cytochrome c biogenesis protein CcsA [Candidatus Poseidoniaceae archaeon]